MNDMGGVRSDNHSWRLEGETYPKHETIELRECSIGMHNHGPLFQPPALLLIKLQLHAPLDGPGAVTVSSSVCYSEHRLDAMLHISAR